MCSNMGSFDIMVSQLTDSYLSSAANIKSTKCLMSSLGSHPRDSSPNMKKKETEETVPNRSI